MKKFLSYGFKRVINRFPVWFSQAMAIIKNDGLITFVNRAILKLYRFMKYSGDPNKMQQSGFENWMKNVESKYLHEQAMDKRFSSIKSKPKFSIIFPTWNKSSEMIEAALNSVFEQHYENWELCISDGSTRYVDETKALLERYKKMYPKKIKLTYLEDPPDVNIVENRNSCLSMATGEYCVFLDCDDELAQNCLLELAVAIDKNPGVDFIYSDYDKITTDGRRSNPAFLPDWSLHTTLSRMYTTHVTCYKTEFLKDIGWFRNGYEGADDYDLALRASDKLKPENVIHIPKILYHWRVYPESTALSSGGDKDWAQKSQQKALENWIDRNSEEAKVLDGPYAGTWRVRFKILGSPKVTIVIPFRDKVEFLRQCIKSIESKTKYESYKIVLVNNQSKETDTLEYLKSVGEKYEILNYNEPYSFSKLNNWAVEQIDGDHVLLLNNDTEVINKGWLGAMLEYSQRPEVGAVGAKLLYKNGKIQHAGVVVGMGIGAAHPHRMMDSDQPGYLGNLKNPTNYLAVTAACIMVKRDLFLELGGLNSELDPAFQDVDFCIRLHKKGLWNVYTPYAKLYHYESVTRLSKKLKDGLESDKVNANKLQKLWPEFYRDSNKHVSHDPFFNPNLDARYEDLRLRVN